MLQTWGLLTASITMVTVIAACLAAYYMLSSAYRRWEFDSRVLKLGADVETRERRQRGLLLRLGDSLDRTGWGQKMRQQLRMADLNITPSEYIGAVVLLAVVIFLGVKLLFRVTPWVNVIAAVLGAYLISRSYLRSRRDHYIASFDAQMPEVALLMSNSLRAGLSIQQGFGVVAEKMEPPAGYEFGRISREIRIGLPIDEAMRKMMELVPSEELRLMMTTIMIQRVAGGNLAHALSVMSTAISARFQLKDEIRTMTAETRFSAVIIMILPVVVLALLDRIMEGSVATFLSNPIGLVMTILFVGIMVLAFYLINKVSMIEV